MKKGIITNVVTARGFGFIRSDAVSRDIFFHASACLPGTDYETMKKGEAVGFEIKETPKGYVAVGVVYC